MCIWLRECREVLKVLAFKPELTKLDRFYLDILVDKASCKPIQVTLERDQPAILKANPARQLLWKVGAISFYHVEVARLDIFVHKASCMPFLVALKEDQQAILRASVAPEQIRRDNLNGKFGQYLPHVEVARLKFLACYILCGEVYSQKPHTFMTFSDGDLILERLR